MQHALEYAALSSKLKRPLRTWQAKSMLFAVYKAIKDFCRLFEACQTAPSSCLFPQYMGCTSFRGLSAALQTADASLDLAVWAAVGTSFLLDVCRAEPFASEGSQRSL